MNTVNIAEGAEKLIAYFSHMAKVETMHICQNTSKPTNSSSISDIKVLCKVKAPNQGTESQRIVKRTKCRLALLSWSLVVRKENFMFT